MYAVDMHTHTSHYSTCGHQTIEELVLAAYEKGLHAICVTEHEFRWPDEDLREVVRRLGLEGKITVLAGEEIPSYSSDGVRYGDWLIFGIEKTIGRGDIRQILPWVHEQGGIVIAAHPMRPGYNSDKIVYELDVDALEVRNKAYGPDEEAKAWECVRRTGKLPVANSDAHRAEHVGMYVTYFEQPVLTLQDLLRQIRERRVRVEPQIRTAAAG